MRRSAAPVTAPPFWFAGITPDAGHASTGEKSREFHHGKTRCNSCADAFNFISSFSTLSRDQTPGVVLTSSEDFGSLCYPACLARSNGNQGLNNG
jgi:hypothetical protein